MWRRRRRRRGTREQHTNDTAKKSVEREGWRKWKRNWEEATMSMRELVTDKLEKKWLDSMQNKVAKSCKKREIMALSKKNLFF